MSFIAWMKKPTNLLFFVSFCLLLYAVGYKSGQYSTKQTIQGTNKSYIVTKQEEGNTYNIDFSLFWDTWKELENQFVDKDKLDPKEMYYGAIKGMVASLGDPYTFFLTPKENQSSKDDLGGKFEGIGAELGLENNQIIITSPLQDSPAEKAGIKPRDQILKVDGDSTAGWTLSQAVQKIRGEKGTKVTLTILRGNDQKDITIVRNTITVASVETSYAKSTAIIHLNRFGDTTNNEWDKAIDEISLKIQNGTVKDVLLDVRNNPGGFLDGAVYIASEFLPKGKLVVRQEYKSGKYEDYSVERAGRLLAIPTAVLVNGGSASASEIVAGALRDHGRAKVIGEKSFGKGSIQVALDLKDGAGVHVTIAKWKLPKGDWIHQKGIEPQVKIPQTELANGDTITDETDSQLQKAIEYIEKNSK
ncbi:MAG: putative CtpA-like serine protease [Microgenomates bacterium OLB22]|nr:MAG: putative CtpA-like serine protease [Microgenomates bacterium OLB22]